MLTAGSTPSSRVARMKSDARRTEGYRMPARPSRRSTLTWRKSSASADAPQCVEIACTGLSVLVRDSRHKSGDVLAFTPVQWSAFLQRIRNGELGADQG